jgi:hypothetical protein
MREESRYNAATDELMYETYESVGVLYDCIDDCSGHDAGF